MVIGVPLETVVTPPASEIVTVAAPAETARVEVIDTPELKFVVSVGVRVAVRVVVPWPVIVIVVLATVATLEFELVYVNVPAAFEVGAVTV